MSTARSGLAGTFPPSPGVGAGTWTGSATVPGMGGGRRSVRFPAHQASTAARPPPGRWRPPRNPPPPPPGRGTPPGGPPPRPARSPPAATRPGARSAAQRPPPSEASPAPTRTAAARSSKQVVCPVIHALGPRSRPSPARSWPGWQARCSHPTRTGTPRPAAGRKPRCPRPLGLLGTWPGFVKPGVGSAPGAGGRRCGSGRVTRCINRRRTSQDHHGAGVTSHRARW